MSSSQEIHARATQVAFEMLAKIARENVSLCFEPRKTPRRSLKVGDKAIGVRGTSLKKNASFQVHDSDVESYKKLYDYIAFVNLAEGKVFFLTPDELEPLRYNQGPAYKGGANNIDWSVVQENGRVYQP